MCRKGLLAGSMAVAVVLAGCGGGGGGGSSGSSSSSNSSGSSYTPAVTSLADGIWDYSSGSYNLIGAIAPNGMSIFVNTGTTSPGSTSTSGRLYTFPTMTLSGSSQIDGKLRHYTQQGLVSSASSSNIVDETYTGALVQHSSLSGTITSGTGSDFAFSFDSMYNTAISLSDLAASGGQYGGKADDGSDAAVSVSNDGSFTAGINYSGSPSCIIKGTLKPVDSSHDLFIATASVSGCSSGSLEGLAFTGDKNAKSLFLGLIRADSGANGTVIVGFKP